MLTVDSHPHGLRYLYVAVAGHAFAWYTVYNLFVLWLKHSGQTDAVATSNYGNLVAAAYLLPLVGGVVASGIAFKAPLSWTRRGRFTSFLYGTADDLHYKVKGLSPLRTALLGGLVAAVGYVALMLTASTPTTTTLVALGCITLGVGLSKPNLSAMVGRLFPSGSVHADAAFARYYSFINVGSLVSPLIAGWLATSVSFAAAFSIAVLGEIVVVMSLLLGRRHLAMTSSESSLVALVGDVEVDGKTTSPQLPGRLVDDAVGHEPAVDALKHRKLVALWIFFAFAALAFWPAYSQNGSGLNLWALDHTDRVLSFASYTYTVPPTWFATINSIICILASVPLVKLFSKFSLSNSTAVGYVLMAASFGTLVVAPAVSAAPGYLVASIVLSSLSEVLISTVGLAQVAKLAPRHQASSYMAVWFLTVAVGGKLAGFMGGFGLQTGFRVLTVAALVAAALTLASRRWLDVAATASGSSQEAVTAGQPDRSMAASSSGLVARPAHSSGEV